MKKVILCFLCVVVCFSQGGCVNKENRISSWLNSDDEMADQIMEDIISMLNRRDEEGLKNMFSKKALEYAENIDEKIEKLMDFYQGKTTKFEGDAASDTLTKYGKDVEKMFKGKYKLITEEAIYQVAYQHRPINQDPDKVGLISFEIVSEEKYQEQVDQQGHFNWQYADNPGVYVND